MKNLFDPSQFQKSFFLHFFEGFGTLLLNSMVLVLPPFVNLEPKIILNHFSPTPLTSGVSPKPILQKYTLGSGFTSCDDLEGKEELEELVRASTTSVPCVVQEECFVTVVSCSQNEISVVVKPAFLHHIEKQKLLLNSSLLFMTKLGQILLANEVSHQFESLP